MHYVWIPVGTMEVIPRDDCYYDDDAAVIVSIFWEIIDDGVVLVRALALALGLERCDFVVKETKMMMLNSLVTRRSGQHHPFLLPFPVLTRTLALVRTLVRCGHVPVPPVLIFHLILPAPQPLPDA